VISSVNLLVTGAVERYLAALNGAAPGGPPQPFQASRRNFKKDQVMAERDERVPTVLVIQAKALIDSATG
jgi:hypothetical protein